MSTNLTEICSFSLLLMFIDLVLFITCFAKNIFGAFYKNFFNGFEIIVKFCIYDIFYGKKSFWSY
jgi:hypothetical protein